MADAALVCLADFNVHNLTAYLADPADPPVVRTVATDYGQVVPLLLDGSAPCWRGPLDAVLIWTRPDVVSPTFQRLIRHEPVSRERILAEVDGFLDLVTQAAGRARCVLVPTWTMPANQRGFGPLDMHPEIGPRGVLLQMNARLAARLGTERGPSTTSC
jgi:hypothetical protein